MLMITWPLYACIPSRTLCFKQYGLNVRVSDTNGVVAYTFHGTYSLPLSSLSSLFLYFPLFEPFFYLPLCLSFSLYLSITIYVNLFIAWRLNHPPSSFPPFELTTISKTSIWSKYVTIGYQSGIQCVVDSIHCYVIRVLQPPICKSISVKEQRPVFSILSL